MAAGVALSTALAAVPALAGSPHRTEAQNHLAAERNASKLLSVTSLPPSATSASGEPSGDSGVLADPALTDGVANLVDKHAWWTVNESPDLVLDYVEAHPPAGGSLQVTCSGRSSEKDWSCVGFSFPARSGVLGDRLLVVKIVGLADGSTGVRADAEVQWIVPRPASESVPAGVTVINVVRGVPGHRPDISRTVTKRRQIRRIIDLVDGLPTLQPGRWHCPAIRSDGQIVSLVFRGSSHGAPLARLSVRADTGDSATGCDAMNFSVRGTRETPLVHAATFLRGVQRVIGAQLLERRGGS